MKLLYKISCAAFSKNKVPIASGIRCNDKNKLQVVVDHLLGPAHETVVEHKRLLAL